MKKSINLKLLLFVLPVLLLAASCKKDHDVKLAPIGKYENGFFIVNEGNYGHDHGGTVTYYDYSKQTLTDSIFTKENSGKTFDPNTSTLEFGAIFNKKIYLVTKSGGPLVVADENSLKETGRIAADPANDWRSFLPLDNTKALVSAHDGIYPFNLQTLLMGPKLPAVTGEIGDMIKAGNYIFALSAADGIVVLNAADYSVAKKVSGVGVGFAKTTDGMVWAAGGDKLYRIDPASLNVSTISLPFTVYDSWFAWHAGSIVASASENAVFIVNNGQYEGGADIYKYVDSNAGSLSKPFITLPASDETYGKGIGFDAKTGHLVVTAVHTGFDFNDNDLIIYDAAKGTLLKDISFTGYYYPAIPVFH